MTEHQHPASGAADAAAPGTVPFDSVLSGNDAWTRLVDVWLDGYTSGVATALMNGAAAANGDETAPAEVSPDVERLARVYAEAAAMDPLFVEEIRREVAHILVCPLTGPERWKVDR